MKTIFVVDDNGINLMKADEALSDHFNVITISSAFTMFELFDDVIPDMILLDIMMPDINGFDVLERLKADVRYAGIPVIFLTSMNDAAEEARGYKMGAMDFIKKPFSKQILLDRIKTVLESGDSKC
ncbi:MAG: response regulator [Treponema sp.]|nr:response regulator [Treponema sp.]